ncbi:DEAD/DEAH box helicase family protein [Mesorhizobium ciceri]|uniref:DEAD/DEAH box helicase n=1 Tax=Mesorhizobium TaxID=68287 RepID=UPI0007A94D94|nr:DEAD/DEAH box helicase family protein [Mesorhizobium ciceri]AMX98789.1 hypothetical protein A4R29_04105 [Mesorhizobium ciceri biovar biserrulae]
MDLEDLLTPDGETDNPSISRQGGRVCLDKDAISKAGYRLFEKLSGQLDTHDFWTAAPTQKKYLPDVGLWAPQRRAVGLSLAYLAARRTAKEGAGAALVKMPTGTGKTGVIATLACAVEDIKRTLVITPRRALVDQMLADLHTRLWSRFGLIYSGTEVRARAVGDADVGSRAIKGPVWRLLPSDAATLTTIADDRIVVVGTFAALEQILRPDRPAHRLSGRRPLGGDEIPPDPEENADLKEPDRKKLVALLKSFDLVIVDESHYEPAFIWSQCIRQLGLPTVLFSATPYRNDFRYFDIDGRFAFNLSYDEARKRRLIRDVKVLADDPSATAGESFPKRLIRFADQVARETNPDHPGRGRIIVRGDTHESLVTLRQELGALGQRSVLIHHKEKRNAAALRFQNVMDALAAHETEDVRFWLHQWKLLEGVDDSRFGGVAVSEPFTTSRAVVQQIGRVLRYGDRKRAETALVIGREGLGVDLAERFDRYMSYEQRFNANPSEALRRETQFFETLRAASPAVQYISGDFRDRFDLDDDQVGFADIQLPCRAYVMRNTGGRSLDEIAEASQLAMGLEDRHDATIFRPSGSKDPSGLRLIVYVLWGNSPLLIRRAMPTWNLGVMALVEVGNRIFLLDTEGLVIDPEKLGLEPESPEKMQLLVPAAGPGETSRVTVASALSLDISDMGVRAATVRMRDFSEGFYDLAQGMQATTSVRASIRRKGAVTTALRYLSLQRSSVSDGSGKYVPIVEYATWVSSVAAQLESKDTPSRAFQRFAQAVPAPAAGKAVPVNVLFDFAEMIGDGGEHAPPHWNTHNVAGLISADRCLDVEPDGSFTIQVDDHLFDGKLKYEITGALRRRGRYVVECADLDAHLVGHDVTRKEKPQLLSGMLTRDQAFRVIPTDPTLIYAQRHFYHPRMSIDEIAKNPPGGPLEFLTGSPWLATVISEKGNAKSAIKEWVSSSIFGGFYAQAGLASHGAANTRYRSAIRALDPTLADLLDKFSFVVCDDGGTETCDFICVDDVDPRLVLIHAKVDDTIMSLNALQAVGRQAQASIAFLTRIESFPDRTADWQTPVTIKDGQIASRVVKGTDPVPELWERARDAARSVRYKKEIWILAGSILQRQALVDELKKPAPSPRSRQMIYYLASLQTSANRANIGMRIYCSP